MTIGPKPHLLVSITVVCFIHGHSLEDTNTTAYGQDDLPDPRSDPLGCGQPRPSFVCDPGRVLTVYEVWELNDIVESLPLTWTCLCDGEDPPCIGTYPHEVKVAVLPRVKVTTGHVSDRGEEHQSVNEVFAKYLLDKSWKSDLRLCSMRMVIVYDLHSKEVGTARNYYANRVISESNVDAVETIANFQYFHNSQTFQGLRYMLQNYRAFLYQGVHDNAPLPDESKTSSGSDTSLYWWEILLIAVGGTIAVFGIVWCLHSCNCIMGVGEGGVWSSPSTEDCTKAADCGAACAAGCGGGCGGCGGD